jgi:hypothetical protein
VREKVSPRCLVSLTLILPRLTQVKRILFRFIFVVSLFILSIDGLTPHKHINESSYVMVIHSLVVAIDADAGLSF